MKTSSTETEKGMNGRLLTGRRPSFPPSAPTQTSPRLTWLAIMRGITILLVVMNHVQLIDLSTGENHPFCEQVSQWFAPFRMPLFIFSSGGLLFLSRIDKGRNTPEVYRDKWGRIMTLFFFFVIVYYGIKWLMAGIVKTPTTLSMSDFLLSFVYFGGRPSAPLWFLATLMTLMLLYPLFRWLAEVPWRMHAFLPLTIALRFADLSAYETYNIFNLLQLHHHLVYFFFGIYFFRFRLYRFLDGMGLFIVLLCMYLGLALIHMDFGAAMVGIMLMVSLSRLLERPLPGLCRHWRDYVFQVYLMGMICQGVVELIIWKRWCYNESLFAVFYVLNIAAGLYIPVLIAKTVERCPVKFIRLCFGLK